MEIPGCARNLVACFALLLRYDIETFEAPSLDKLIKEYMKYLINEDNGYEPNKKRIELDIKRGYSDKWEDYFFIKEKGIGIVWSH